MSPAAVALQFPDPDLVDADEANAEWSQEQEEAAVSAAAGQQARRAEALRNGLRIGQPDGTPLSLDELKAEVAMVVAGGRGAGPAWPTGVAELDAALGGGVPRGRVTEVVGPLGAGKTSLVRQLVARVLADGGWVSWVDATRTLAPQDLAGLGERLIIVRPHDHTRGAWCADLLLRSGVFALVVLDGAPVLSRTVGVRLSQLARERDAAFVVLRDGTQASRLGGAVRLQIRPVQTVHAKSGAANASSAVNSGAELSGAATISNSQNRNAMNRRSLNNSASGNPTGSLNNTLRNTLNNNALHNTSLGNSSPVTPPGAPHKSSWRERRTPDRKFSVLVEKGGSYRTVEVTCAIVVARRVCADTEIPDRRGVARGTRAAGGAEQEFERGEQERRSESFGENAESVSATAGREREHVERERFAHEHERKDAERKHAECEHAADASVVRKHRDDPAWKKGRGRPRMAESTYGRTTRRGKARQFLSNREHASKHDGDYERKQRTTESGDKHTGQPNRQQERRESRRQSRRELNQYAGVR